MSTDKLHTPETNKTPPFTFPSFKARYHTAGLDTSPLHRSMGVYDDRIELEREVILVRDILAVRLSPGEELGNREQDRSIVTVTLKGGGFRRWVLTTKEANKLKHRIEMAVILYNPGSP